MTAARTLRRAAVGLVALVALGAGCTPLFVPPVPSQTLAPAPTWRVGGDAELRAVDVGGEVRLRARWRFDEVPGAAWVAVQWFGPAGGERASASVWVTPADVGRPFVLELPSDVAVEPGPWRALVSVGGRVLRQLDAEVPTPDAP